MRWSLAVVFAGLLGVSPVCSSAQVATLDATAAAPTANNTTDPPLPDISALLRDVDRNQHRLEAERRDYTYHVHMEQEEFDRHGVQKKKEVTEAESLTVDGIRVHRVVARNGKPLTPEEQEKENKRIDQALAKAKERRSKADDKGSETDERGSEVLRLSRILELGKFSKPRRVELNGRSSIALDYAGDPNAKTHSVFEGIMRDLVGTIWIDEQDRVLAATQGHFLKDFKLGGDLLAEVHKDTSLAFRATRVTDSVWLPATIDGQGSARLLLFAGFNGRLHLVTSDYRRFRTSATIREGHGEVGPDGEPVASQSFQGDNPQSATPK